LYNEPTNAQLVGKLLTAPCYNAPTYFDIIVSSSGRL